MPKNDCTFENVDKTLKTFLPTKIPPFSLEPYLEEIHKYFKAELLEEVFSNLERSKTEFAKQQLNELKKMVNFNLSYILIYLNFRVQLH